MLIAIIRYADTGETAGLIDVEPKTFRTGSAGYYGQKKLVIDGRRYQVQVQLVEIGSKPAPAPAAEPK
jgi:hypothetical protein